MAGTRTVSPAENREEAKKFIDELNECIADSESTIKETEFPVAGRYATVRLNGEEHELVMDHLGRVLVPVKYARTLNLDRETYDLERVLVNGEALDILRVEPRYVGDDITSYVLYLGKERQHEAGIEGRD